MKLLVKNYRLSYCHFQKKFVDGLSWTAVIFAKFLKIFKVQLTLSNFIEK